MGLPMLAEMRGAISRASKSVVVPLAYGTIMRNGREGKPCALAGAAGNHDRRLPRPELRAVQAQHLPPVEYAARMREGLVPSNG